MKEVVWAKSSHDIRCTRVNVNGLVLHIYKKANFVLFMMKEAEYAYTICLTLTMLKLKPVQRSPAQSTTKQHNVK